MTVSTFMFATGIENSYPTINGGRTRIDEMEKCGHYTLWKADFDLLDEVGIRYLRYGPPIHTTWRYCQLGAEEAKLPRAQPSGQSTLAHEGSTGRIAPGEEGAIASSPVLIGRHAMTAELEVVVDRAMD